MTEEELAELKSLIVEYLNERSLVSFLRLIACECGKQKVNWEFYNKLFVDMAKKERDKDD